jgi:hypothetical protein
MKPAVREQEKAEDVRDCSGERAKQWEGSNKGCGSQEEGSSERAAVKSSSKEGGSSERAAAVRQWHLEAVRVGYKAVICDSEGCPNIPRG